MNFPLPGNIRLLRRRSLIGQLVLLALAVELLVLASFTSLPLPVPTKHNLEHFTNRQIKPVLAYSPGSFQKLVCRRFPVLSRPQPAVRRSAYVPLCPAAIFIGYTLGMPLACLAPAIFVVVGIFGCYLGILPFACGGGLDYYLQPGFGYLLGLSVGAWLSARITPAGASSLRQIGSALGGVLAVHIVGLLYITGGAAAFLLGGGQPAHLNWQPWLFENIRNLSWYALPYDALFSLGLIGIAFPFRFVNSTLTAPDIGVRPKPKWDRHLERVP